MLALNQTGTAARCATMSMKGSVNAASGASIKRRARCPATYPAINGGVIDAGHVSNKIQLRGVRPDPF